MVLDVEEVARGEVAVIYLEADDLDAAFSTIGGSGEPFDRWFRDYDCEV